ncbi:MAG: ABC transporter substrate-binding protein [Lachnospirales bacterium]
MKINFKKFITATVLALTLGLVSCDTTETTAVNENVTADVETTNEVVQTTETVEVEPEPEHIVEEVVMAEDVYGFADASNEVVINEDSVTFVDERGSEVTISKNPERVVPLVNSYANLWYEAGGDIVGRIDSESELPEEYLGESISTVGDMTEVNMELLLDLDPDLVILRQSKQADLIPLLEESSIPYITMEYNSMSDYLKYLKIFTALTGNEDLYIENGENVLNDVNETIAKVPSENNPTVLLIFGTTSSLKAYLSNTANGEMIAQLKGNNIADSWEDTDATSIEINTEYVIDSDPDYILVQCMSSEDGVRENIEATFGTTDWWNSLSAVKEGNVVYLDRAMFHYKPNSRYNEAYEELADILYPEVFGE